jgi:uncharacterized protein DUF5990
MPVERKSNAAGKINSCNVKPLKQQIRVSIVLSDPPPGVDFGIQKGKGNIYDTIQTQRSNGSDLHFEFLVDLKQGDQTMADFGGDSVHGPLGERFIYIDIGTCAGQKETQWTRRLKIPLRDISDEMIKAVVDDDKRALHITVPGTGRDGGPNCATVKPFPGWRLANAAKR